MICQRHVSPSSNACQLLESECTRKSALDSLSPRVELAPDDRKTGASTGGIEVEAVDEDLRASCDWSERE